MTNAIECLQCKKPLFSCEHRVSPRKALRNAHKQAVKYYQEVPYDSKQGRELRGARDYYEALKS